MRNDPPDTSPPAAAPEPGRSAALADAGFVCGLGGLIALSLAYAFGVARWIPGLEGPAAFLLVGAFPLALAGIRLSVAGRRSPARHGLASASALLSLAVMIAALLGIGWLALGWWECSCV